MTKFVDSINIIGLHGQFDFFCKFQEGVNVIYGRNGSGKTTLLHILANVVNGDFLRFSALDFSSIEVNFSDGQSVKIELEKFSYKDHYHGFIKVDGSRINEIEFCPRNPQSTYEHLFRNSEEYDPFEVGRDFSQAAKDIAAKLPNIELSAAYFPAFRTAIDAWAINGVNAPSQRAILKRQYQHKKTDFARNLFGQFMPRLDYPATSEIENDLNNQVRAAIAKVSQADRKFFGDVPSKILETLTQGRASDDDTSDILAKIEALSARYQDYPLQVESMWNKLSESVQAVPEDPDNQRVTKTVLNAYKEALGQIVDVQEESFAAVEKYLSSVNLFLEGKNVGISSPNTNGNARPSNRNTPSVVIKYASKKSPVMSMSEALSSGERQIATLIYAATRLNQQDLILIDEPEISLNVDWQRKLLPEMQKQMPSKQLIVCTHSPIVGAKYRERMIELSPRPTENPQSFHVDFIDNDEVEHG